MSWIAGMLDCNGVEIENGDTVFCWDGNRSQSEVTAALEGIINIRVTESGIKQLCVDDNELALGCAEFVEVISKAKKSPNIK